VKPRRSLFRYARFSLAALGIVVAIACIALAPWVNRIHFQERVIADVERLGGIVTCQRDTDSTLMPNWLQQRLGERYFRRVVGINLGQQTPPQELLARIAQLHGVEQLSVQDSKFTDEALRPIGRMRKLKVLRIGFNEITDEGLVHLADLKELVVLDLCVTKVTDAGLSRLKPLTNLRRLELYGNEITNRGTSTLGQIPTLCDLDLGNTKITSVGLEPLAALPELSYLRLDQMILGQGQELRINDDAVPILLTMPKLTNLSIAGLPISPTAIADLKRGKPGIAIQQ
jgi:hypothetical protein